LTLNYFLSLADPLYDLYKLRTKGLSVLGKALAEGKLEERLKTTQQQLLIIDESDYLLIGRQGANWLFELVSRRYERG
jgi:DNA replication protein DnaC